MKHILRSVIALFACVWLCSSYISVHASSQRLNPYSDVYEDMWSYEVIETLFRHNVISESMELKPLENESRAAFVSYLHRLDLMLGSDGEQAAEVVFSDVPANHPYFDAVYWAQKNGIVNGVGEGRFTPNDPLTRESICTILMRYVQHAGIKLKLKHPATQFVDSLRISDYARSAVVACQMAQIMNGYGNGFFKPFECISREEALAVVYRVFDAAMNPPTGYAKLVNTAVGAYDALYSNFLPVPDPVVPLSDPVDLSYFDRVAFVGDSVSLRLQYYCAATRALGNATFLCAGSLSASNALYPAGPSTFHPSYLGKKMLVEECVSASGAEIVYIMLGINNISFGVERATADMMTLIERILELSPNVKIMIQSVTPMASTSSILSNKLNNDRINEYNRIMKDYCLENGWYYVNVAEAVSDASGYLVPDYCSDNAGMGIHFTNAAAEVWVDYLLTHVPEKIK